MVSRREAARLRRQNSGRPAAEHPDGRCGWLGAGGGRPVRDRGAQLLGPVLDARRLDRLQSSSVPRPGLFRFDPASREIATIPGSDALRYPKCSRQGDLLALSVAGTGRRHVLRTGHRTWEDLGPLAGLAWYPNWTRNGHSFCGLTATDHPCRVLLPSDTAARAAGGGSRAEPQVLDRGAVDGPRRQRHATRHRRPQHDRPLLPRLGSAVDRRRSFAGLTDTATPRAG